MTTGTKPVTRHRTPLTSAQRRDIILQTMARLQRPICLADLLPRASEHGAYEKAFKALFMEQRIVVDHVGAHRQKFYRMQPCERCG